MDERTKRIGQNEALFRRVNDAIEDIREPSDGSGEYFEIVCECGDETCIEHIRMPHTKYEHMRAETARFAIKPHHIAVDVETVIERTERYWIVEKHVGEPARLARELRQRQA